MQQGFFVLFSEFAIELKKRKLSLSDSEKSLVDIFWSLMSVAYDDLFNSRKIISFREHRLFHTNIALFMSDFSKKESINFSLSYKKRILKYYGIAVLYRFLRKFVLISKISRFNLERSGRRYE
jgi:hypothetical protein